MSDQDFQQQVIDRLDGLSAKLTTEVDRLSHKIDKGNEQAERFDEKFVEYRQATQWIVQLSFGLIAFATVIPIVSTIFKR